ncbi:uncharacterized protein [Cherax quadricarinatus]|uniref:uncharacterized protein isoform X2 n=1 Tax=Cherax quadricarinatus TaxID=27406 RepID=UPI00387E8129
MKLTVMVCIALLAEWSTSSSTEAPTIYHTIKVQQRVSSHPNNGSEFIDIINTLLPDISKLLRDIKAKSTDTSLRQAKRFQSLIELLLPLIRRIIEFQAEDEGRQVNQEDVEMLDNVELAIKYLNELAESDFQLENHPDTQMADYTEIRLPDYTKVQTEIPVPGKLITHSGVKETAVSKHELSHKSKPISLEGYGTRNIRPVRKVPTSIRPFENLPSLDQIPVKDMLMEITSAKTGIPLNIKKPTTTVLPGSSYRHIPASRWLRQQMSGNKWVLESS